MSKQTRGDAGESKVEKVLDSLPIYHQLINNLMLVSTSCVSHQIDHIFICEKGVFVIETKNYYGKISSDPRDSIWTKEIKGKKIVISNPLTQNKSHVRIIKATLKEETTIIPVTVFVKNNAPYMGDENVINLEDLPLFISEFPCKKPLSREKIDYFAHILLVSESDISIDEHLKNIKEIKTNRKKEQEDMRYAIEHRSCPKCHKPMVIKNQYLMCTGCSYKFKV